MLRNRRFAPLATILLAVSGCGDFPKDAESNLEEVEAGRPLRVGWSDAGPWVRGRDGAEPAGIEPDLLRRWAAGRGFRIQWIEASEGQLVEGLNENSLDIAVAGFTDQAPHGGMIGMTQPYLRPKVVIAMAPGADAPESWKGVPIAHDPRRPEFAGLLMREQAAATTGPAPFRILYEPEAAAAGLTATGKTLRTERRTIATSPSANALTLELDRWLHANRAAIEARLAQEGRP